MLNRKMMLLALMAAFLAAGCELAQLPQATPTAAPETTIPITAPTLTPSPTLTQIAQLESPSPTETPGTPTETPTDTPTPDPYATYVIQPNDTLLYIIQLPPFNYRTDAVVNEILRLNSNMTDINHLPPPGSSIIIPLPSATASPEGFELTASAQPNAPQNGVPGNSQIVQVTVKEGETIVGIAGQNATTLVILATLNPQLSFYNCDFNNPSGGPDCNVSLRIGDAVNVPALTPTPTLSPTISGSETPTPTPTYAAPMLLFPPQDANAGARTFQLQWISVGVLKEDEVYLVEIKDDTSGGEPFRDITRSTSYLLPESMIPTDGQAHTIEWRVSVAAPNDQGVYRYIGAAGDWRPFHWQSR
jgi:LysM domain